MVRRTQAERSSSTRSALTGAAIELLIEHGWAAATAGKVCERAGVTRGALVHHFVDLGGLLAATLDRLYLDMVTAVGEPATTTRGTLEHAWTAMRDRRFKAVLEAWWAAGNDPELARAIGPVIARFSSLVSPVSSPATGDGEPGVGVFLLTAREALLGLALGRATGGGRPLGHEAAVVEALFHAADELDERHRAAKGTTT